MFGLSPGSSRPRNVGQKERVDEFSSSNSHGSGGVLGVLPLRPRFGHVCGTGGDGRAQAENEFVSRNDLPHHPPAAGFADGHLRQRHSQAHEARPRSTSRLFFFPTSGAV